MAIQLSPLFPFGEAGSAIRLSSDRPEIDDSRTLLAPLKHYHSNKTLSLKSNSTYYEMTETILYISSCPVCDQGLVRLRTLKRQSHFSPVCQCDECDAAWKTPKLDERLTRSDMDRLLQECDSTHWSLMEEVCLFGWAGFVRHSTTTTAQDSD